MADSRLVQALVASSVPREDSLAREVASRLFPTWQAVLVGAPIALILGAVLGLAASLAIALPLGAIVGDPKPAWFGRMSEAVMVLGVLAAIWLVVRWMRHRREFFRRLAREGTIVPAYDIASRSSLSTPLGAAIARAAFGGVGATAVQIFGGPIAAADLDSHVIEARTTTDMRGRFRVPEWMLANETGDYVALMHRTGWITPQRVLRRRALDRAEHR